MRALAAVLLIACIFLAREADASLGALRPSGETSDPLSRLVGSSKEAFGDTLFIKADEYFHGGVMHDHHEDESATDLAREGVLEEGAPEGHDHEDWIARMNHAVHAHELMHLKKEDRKEMLPFFYSAVTLDPHNVEALLTTAHWLDREFGGTAEARALLEKGIRDNPDSWELEAGLAKIQSRAGERTAAAGHWRAAVEKAGRSGPEDFERVTLYHDLGESEEGMGRPGAALDAYEKASRYFDDKTAPYLRSVIEEKIKQLRGES